MMPLILTGLVGIAIGVAVMRLLGATPRNSQDAPAQIESAESLSDQKRLSVFGSFSKNQLMFGGAGVMALLAAIIYVVRPAETAVGSASGTAVAPQAGAPSSAALDDVDTMISKLAERLKTDTADGEGFRMLGWSYMNTGHSAEAVTAYSKAAVLLPQRADVHAGYGEALTAVARDVVTAEAKGHFDTAIRLDPNEPRARFFLSLYKAQNGSERDALDEWIALANSSPSDLPWQADIRQRIGKLAAKLGVDTSGRLKAGTSPAPATSENSSGPNAAAMAAASRLPATEQQGMITNMVDGLAAKLQANPDNVEGWVKLIRSRVVLKDASRARDDIAMARRAFAGKPEKLGQIDALATELGL